MKYGRAALFVVTMGLSGLVAIGCVDRGGETDATIEVGAILPLSGENASFGATSRAAFEIAQADADSAGGLTLRIVYGDSQLEVDQALVEWRRLVQQDRVVAFTEVTGSGVALALAGIAERDRVPMISGINTSPALTTEGGDYFFRVIPSDAYSAQVLSDWSTSEGLTRGALIYNQQNSWATGFHSAITGAYPALAGSLPSEAVITVTNPTVDFGPAIGTLRSYEPNVVFVGLMGRQAGLFVSQAVDRGLMGPFLGVDNLAQQEFTEAAGPAATYARLVLPNQASSERAARFAEAYEAKTGRSPDATAYTAYDAFMTLLAAIESVYGRGQEVTGEAIRAELTEIKIDGLTGPISFDENQDLEQAAYSRFTFAADGSFIPVQPGDG